MEKSNRIRPPWHIIIEDQRQDNKLTSRMMDKQCFLAQRLSSINNVFDDSIENIEDTCDQLEKSGNVIRE